MRFARAVSLLTRLGWLLAAAAPAATTDGVATFTVTLSDPAGNYNRRVDAYWVTDSTGKFVQTVRKDAATRQTYLYQYLAARGSWTGVDGSSGATISTWGTFSVTWDCRDTNEVIVPDGTYKFYVEMTDHDGQGWWTTNGLSFTKGPGAFSNTYPDMENITGLSVAFTPLISHDIAVASLTPSVGTVESTVNLQVRVTNQTSQTESFLVAVTNLSNGTRLGSQTVTLGSLGSSNVVLAWNTHGVAVGTYQVMAAAGPVTDETYLGNNFITNAMTMRVMTHDLAVRSITTPSLVLPNSTTNVSVAVTNQGDFAEAFGVILQDDTAGVRLGSNWVASLGSMANTNVVFAWSATNAVVGMHTLRAVAGPVAGENSWLDNTNTFAVPVAPSVETNLLIVRSNYWRYNDQGLDLTATPWKRAFYYDGAWGYGRGPFGYGMANLTTTNSYGSDAHNKYPTCYYRSFFTLDFMPFSLTLRLRRDDGIVLYHNGVEVLRSNLPAGPIAYGTYATSEVGNDGTNYLEFALPVTNCVVGTNLLAVEVHQVSPTGPDLCFDAELVALNAQMARIHDVAVASVIPDGPAYNGDYLHVALLLTNRGNVAETFTLYVKDTNTSLLITNITVSGLAAGGTLAWSFDWRTIGMTVGDHGLQALVTIGTQTNFAGMSTGLATLLGTNIDLSAVNATGSIPGRSTAVAKDSRTLLVGAGATLSVYDGTNTVNPVKFADLRLPGNIEGITLGNNAAFVSCGRAGIQVIGLTNPVAPIHLKTIATDGYAYSTFYRPGYLLAACGKAGFRIYSINYPGSPILMGSMATEGPARAVTMSGTTAYLLDQHAGLQMVSLSSVTYPTKLGLFKLDGGVDFRFPPGTNAYVVDGYGKLWIINVTNTSAPILTGSLLLGAVGRSLFVTNSMAYIGAGEAGLLTVSLANPAAPVLVRTNAALQAVAGVVVYDALFAADGFTGVQSFSVTNPAAPAFQNAFGGGVRGAGVAMSQALAYVAGGEGGLKIYSLTNAAAPVLLSSFPGAANALGVAVAGSLLGVADGQYGVKLVNVADPAHPTLAGAYASPELAGVSSVAFCGSFLALSDGVRVQLLNISTPSAPVLASSYTSSGFVRALAASGARLVAATGEKGVLIFGAESGVLSLLGAYNTAGFASDVAIQDTTAYVADGAAGWLILDISNPAAPRLVSSPTAQAPANAVAVAGSAARLAVGQVGVPLVNVSTPLTPVAFTNFAPLVRALRLGASGSLTVAAEDDAGLAVFNSNTNDVNGDGIPDTWEQQIVDASLAQGGPIRSLWDVRPQDDFDGDGLTNYQEYLAGTSPIDRNSVFVTTVSVSSGPAPVTVRWTTVPGRVYTVYRTTDLRVGFTPVASNLPATITSVTDVVAPAGSAFYIVVVQMAP